VDADLDTPAAALYVRTDDLLNDSPQRIPSHRWSATPRWSDRLRCRPVDRGLHDAPVCPL